MILFIFRMLRAEAFTSAMGDRDNVENIAILLTDGNSNDFDETLIQASLAREVIQSV